MVLICVILVNLLSLAFLLVFLMSGLEMVSNSNT